jgi:hypothetical protein
VSVKLIGKGVLSSSKVSMEEKENGLWKIFNLLKNPVDLSFTMGLPRLETKYVPVSKILFH